MRLTAQEDSGSAVHYELRQPEKSLADIQTPSPSRQPSVAYSRPPSTFGGGAFDPNLDYDGEYLDEDSPYPEVRSAVANFDDPQMPAATIRSCLIGMGLAIPFAGIDIFTHLRFPSVMVGPQVALLLAFVLGQAWARWMPRRIILRLDLNPGPYTIKEHVLATIMASVGAPYAYATDIIAVQRVFYQHTDSFIFQWMLTMSSQLIGLSICGLALRFLVTPPSMIWPSQLVLCALFNTLHSQNYSGAGKLGGISRERYFLFAFLAATLWYFVPGYLFQALSFFSWGCWIVPSNVVVNQIFGYRSGLGFSLLTFDWNQISYTGSPLVTPWWATANVMIGFLFFFWFLTPILYYSNVWYSQYLPISSLIAFDNTGSPYNVSRILGADNEINMTAYQAYSPLYLSTTFALSYGSQFLGIAAVITHTVLYFWEPIVKNFRTSLRDQDDIHAKLMAAYEQVPQWYYLSIFVVTFCFACLCLKLWSTGMSIWALIVAILLGIFSRVLPITLIPSGALYNIPIGMIYAITNREVGLSVVTELIVGFMLPGKPVAMMIFKTFGYMTQSQALRFTGNFKLGHYMKIPPRSLFWCQAFAIIITGTVQLGVQAWMFDNIPDLCEPNQKDNFVCAGVQVFGTASIVWGVIGPGLQFSKGQMYFVLMFFFIIGAACPLIHWIITRKYPFTIFNYLNFPLIFTGTGFIPPATSINFVPWAILGFIFQFLLRRRHFAYWAKYNYILSAALDAGTSVGIILVFFCLVYPLDGKIGANSIQKWWGNVVYKNTADWNMAPLKQLPPGEEFGPQ